LQVVIEGHSSEEGDFAFNYELSMIRATAVCKALVEAGVDAQRLSIRGLGEVVPVSGDAAASGDAAINRRVVFHIVERAQGVPTGVPTTPVPWTGAQRAAPGVNK
jgi:OOP family OmpA-OmpF porin